MKYYSKKRPIQPGGYPKPKENKVVEIVNFDAPIYCEKIKSDAWGYIDYEKPLARDEMKNYELTAEIIDVKKVVSLGFDSWHREVFQDEKGCIWKYTEPGLLPRERHDTLYDSNEFDGEPGWPMKPEIDYEIVENFQTDEPNPTVIEKSGIEKLTDISRKYGEVVFRMSVSHLMLKGSEAFTDIDLESVCEKARKETPENSILSADLIDQIIRCCYELAQVDAWELLCFIKTHIKIDGVYTQSGKLLHFCGNATGDSIGVYMVPNEATDEQIEDAKKRLDDAIEEYGKQHSSDYSEFDHGEAIIRAFREVGVKIRQPEYYETIYL